MRDAAQRLVHDLRWRLSPGGKRYRPNASTLRSWGAAEIPGVVPVLLWIAWFIASFFVFAPFGDAAAFLVPLSWLGASIAISRWVRGANNRNIVTAYKRILDQNERFLLIEYTRYIRRKIRLAEADPVLGGPEEVKRLKQVHRKLRIVLEKGRNHDNSVPVRSVISDEADFAESLIEVYDRPEIEEDPLAELDARLPEDIRARLDEFEDDNRQAEQRRLERQ